MKKIILFFGIVLIFSACRNENANKNNVLSNSISDTLSYKYDSVTVYSKNIIKSESKHTDTTKAIISYPVFNNDDLNKFIERQVTDYIAKDEQTASYAYLANSFVKGYDEFYAQNKDTFQNWFLMINITVLNQKKDYIALKYLHADYSGGAHPNTNFTFINYNPKNNQPITLDSLFDQNQKQALTKLGESIFRENEKISPTASLENEYFFENGKFNLPNNFYLSNKGLVFLYNPYEIKPYVAGTTELVIPFTNLKKIAKPNTILSSFN